MEEVVQWINDNYMTFHDPVTGKDSIYWGNGLIYYGIVTPVEVIVRLHGEAINEALEIGTDVKKAIRENDPENRYGFNEIL